MYGFAESQAMIDNNLDFTPVPRRARHDGWTEARQRAFIAALDQLGSVVHAARVVGMTKRSAYRLRKAPGAQSFAAAWDRVANNGQAEQLSHAIDRARIGDTLPLFRKGKQVGTIHRYDNRIAFAALKALDGLERRAKMLSRRGL